MALDGGGGGGGPVGVSNSFTGPAEALELVGDHCFAYSGLIPTSTSTVVMLEFTTGNFYSVVKLQCTGPLDYDEPDNGREANFQLSMNDSPIAILHNDLSEGDIINSVSMIEFVIPAYTAVKVEVDTNESNPSYVTSAVISGRIYRQ